MSGENAVSCVNSVKEIVAAVVYKYTRDKLVDLMEG